MNRELNIAVGRRLRERREYLNISREKLCESVVISPQFLSEVERGVKGLSVDKFLALCDGLGLSADYALRGKESPADVSPIISMLATLDQAYIPLAEDTLKNFFKTVTLKPDK